MGALGAQSTLLKMIKAEKRTRTSTVGQQVRLLPTMPASPAVTVRLLSS